MSAGSRLSQDRPHSDHGVPSRLLPRNPSIFYQFNTAQQEHSPQQLNKFAPKGPAAYGSYIDEPLLFVINTAKYYVHSNDLYSVAALTDSTGTVVERYSYDAYGRQTVEGADGTARLASSYAEPWGFTGRRGDAETGLMYFRARMFSPGLGRFVGRDPLEYTGGRDLYSAYYVPNMSDPFGEKSVVVTLSQGPQILGQRGAAEHTAKFTVTPGSPIEAGFVYQHVTVTATITKCDGSPATSKNLQDFKTRFNLSGDGAASWFERWGTRANRNNTGISVGSIETKHNDQFKTEDEAGCTKGTIDVRGDVKWIPMNVAKGDTDWQDLPWLPSNPLPRHMQVRTYSQWDQWDSLEGGGYHEMLIHYADCEGNRFMHVTVVTDGDVNPTSVSSP